MDIGTVILARTIVGGIDPITGRPLPQQLMDVRTDTGEFTPMGLQAQAVGGIQQNWLAWKIKVRKAVFLDQTHLLAKYQGKDQLFTIQTFSPVFERGQEDRSQIYLIVRTAIDANVLALMVEWRNAHKGGA